MYALNRLSTWGGDVTGGWDRTALIYLHSSLQISSRPHDAMSRDNSQFLRSLIKCLANQGRIKTKFSV